MIMAGSLKQTPSKSSKYLVAAIEFGTAYSSYAYSWKHDWTNVRIKSWTGGAELSYKTPSVLLLNPNKSFNSFGYEAEKKYLSLVEDGENYTEYFFFPRFSEILKKPLEKGAFGKTDRITEKGLSVDAMTIFSHCIRYMKEQLLNELEDRGCAIKLDEIDFVLTVPAICDDTTKMFMREAAVRAGIKSTQLIVASESEAAVTYFRWTHLQMIEKSCKNKSGVKCMILDIGKKTADATVYQLNRDGTSAEIVSTSDDSYNGISINKDFHSFLTDLLGKDVIRTFDTFPEYREDYNQFWQNFKKIFWTFDVKTETEEENGKMTQTDTYFAISIPFVIKQIMEHIGKSCNLKNFKKKSMDSLLNGAIAKSPFKMDLTSGVGKLKIKSSLFRQRIFEPTKKLIHKHLKKIYQELRRNVDIIFFIGEFAECKAIQKEVKEEFQGKCTVVIPESAGWSVVMGAVFFGHQTDFRVLRYTYGIQYWPQFNEEYHEESKRVQMVDGFRCKDVFLKFASKGEQVKPGQKKSVCFHTLGHNKPNLQCCVYISNEKDPMYVDDESCEMLGILEIPLKWRDRNSDIEETLIFGNTELHISAYICKTKREFEKYIYYPS